MEVIKPPKLHTGDVVGICSPSGTMAHKRDLFERAKQNFAKATGLKILEAPHVFSKHYYSAGTAQERLSDFHALIANPDVKAVIFSGGGDTAIDLVRHIDYDLVARNPKIIAGISDATTLLNPITAKTGLVTFLGLEFLDFASHEMGYEVSSIMQAWFSGAIPKFEPNPAWRELDNTHTTHTGWQTIRPGQVEGRLVGGNLESFLQLVGTEYELSFPRRVSQNPHSAAIAQSSAANDKTVGDVPPGTSSPVLSFSHEPGQFRDEKGSGKLSRQILFFETYKLPKKQIHKALMQLKLRGVFERTAGLVIGYCLNSDDPAVVGNEQPIAETVLEVVEDYDFPIMQIGEIGHRVENCLQPIGALARVDAANLRFEILEPVTS